MRVQRSVGVVLCLVAGCMLALFACGGSGSSGGSKHSKAKLPKWVDQILLVNTTLSGTGASATSVDINDNGDAILGYQISNGIDYQNYIANSNVYIANRVGGVWNVPALDEHLDPDYNAGIQNAATFNIVAGIDNSGDISALWKWSNGSGENWLFEGEYWDGTWTLPADNTATLQGGQYYEPAQMVSVTGSGNVLEAYQYYTGGKIHTRARIYNGTDWTLKTFSTAAFLEDSEMSANSDGFVLSFDWYDADRGLLARRYAFANATWDADVVLNANFPGNYVVSSAMDVDANGNAVVVWQDTTDEHVYVAEYRDGTWTIPASVSENINTSCALPDGLDVGMDGNGDLAVIWQCVYATGIGIELTTRTDGVWSDAQRIDQPNAVDDESYDDSIDMNENGDAVIVWRTSDNAGDVSFIYKSERRGGKWYHPTDASDYISPDGYDAENPLVSINESGQAVIAYTAYDLPNYNYSYIFVSETE